DEWVNEIEDRFGKLKPNGHNLVTAAKIRLSSSKLYMEKVLIRSDKVWLTCPDPNSERGKIFFEKGLFQSLLAKIEHVLGTNAYRVTQKDGTVRIVLESIPDLKTASNTLESLI